MAKVTCICETVVDIDAPAAIDLDAEPGRLAGLLDSTFLATDCPNCHRRLRPEFPVRVSWLSRRLDLRIVPEIDRVDMIAAGASAEDAAGICVGYAELAERLRAAIAGLDPDAVEGLKYFLLLRAAEAAPEAEISASFIGVDAGGLEFHLGGIRPDEVAVMKAPRDLYERTLADLKADPTAEPFGSMRVGAYFSVQNLLKPGDGA